MGYVILAESVEKEYPKLYAHENVMFFTQALVTTEESIDVVLGQFGGPDVRSDTRRS